MSHEVIEIHLNDQRLLFYIYLFLFDDPICIYLYTWSRDQNSNQVPKGY